MMIPIDKEDRPKAVLVIFGAWATVVMFCWAMLEAVGALWRWLGVV